MMIVPVRLPRFLSLKWKAMLLTSVVLVAVTGSFVVLNYVDLRQQFKEQREAIHHQHVQQIEGIMEQTGKRLQQLGSVVASLFDIQTALGSEDPARLTAVFDHQWPILVMDMGIDVAAVFDRSGRPLVGRGLPDETDRLGPLAPTIRKVVRTELPHSFQECWVTCLQFAVAPVLQGGRTAGALLLASSLADVVLTFKKISGVEAGLLVADFGDAQAADGAQRWLPQWGVGVAALTDLQANIELLHLASRAHPAFPSRPGPLYLSFAGRRYELRLIPLSGFGATSGYLVVLADVTAAFDHIEVATRRNLSLAATGLFASEALLLGILWAPMSRLRRAGKNLPLLAQGAFEQVRQAISHTPRRSLVRDEVDALDDTAVALSHQLEALQMQVAERSQALSLRMEELAQERDFVTHLLDSAQVIILTQNARNEILLINQFGAALTGYAEAELHNRPFLSLMASEDTMDHMSQALLDLVSGKRQIVQDECDLRCKDGTLRKVVWHHSRLNGQSPWDPVILTAGLDVTDRKQAELHLAWLADHDPLTGLYNRRRFQEELEQAVSAAKRYEFGGALLYLDLDQFKFVNDTSGHQVGDALLREVAELLSRGLREVDVVARVGGDEFAVIIQRASADDAIRVAKKIQTEIGALVFPVDERVIKITASVGIAQFPSHGGTVGDLLANADIAMYQAKDLGRGSWKLFSTEDKSRQRFQEHLLWRDRIENALAEDRFVLYLQPMQDIASGAMEHYEVLVRMRGPDDAIIAPGFFIEVAERTGQIHLIDRTVLSAAMRLQARLLRQGNRVTFAVNLSGHAFEDPELLPHVQNLLEETALDPAQLILEITETAAVSDFAAARRLIEAIRKLGCRFALDDFGAGFASFYYLKELPVDLVKIDGSFIRQLPERPDDQLLVKAMSEIARGFGKKTVAEHVEDGEILRLLGELQIDYAQGYYVGRPAPAQEIFPEIAAMTRDPKTGS